MFLIEELRNPNPTPKRLLLAHGYGLGDQGRMFGPDWMGPSYGVEGGSGEDWLISKLTNLLIKVASRCWKQG